mmetsp:Transcript_54355/g.129517  ORF Transcript_54355/g.129517 Transcript_54355/m.129517 type:complete len:207 (-) Transcript_54355:28-648(-)
MATAGQLQMFNKFTPDEMFGLDDRAYDPIKQKIHRVHRRPDNKVSGACEYHIWLEDHTLGNILRMELLRDEHVLFAGYKVPHPLNHMIELRVQTRPSSTPDMAIRRAIKNLRGETRSILEQFDQGVRQIQKKGEIKDADLTRPDLPQLQDGHALTVQETDATFSGDAMDDQDVDIDLGLDEVAQLEGMRGTSPSPPEAKAESEMEA